MIRYLDLSLAKLVLGWLEIGPNQYLEATLASYSANRYNTWQCLALRLRVSQIDQDDGRGPHPDRSWHHGPVPYSHSFSLDQGLLYPLDKRQKGRTKVMEERP